MKIPMQTLTQSSGGGHGPQQLPCRRLCVWLWKNSITDYHFNRTIATIRAIVQVTFPPLVRYIRIRLSLIIDLIVVLPLFLFSLWRLKTRTLYHRQFQQLIVIICHTRFVIMEVPIIKIVFFFFLISTRVTIWF